MVELVTRILLSALVGEGWLLKSKTEPRNEKRKEGIYKGTKDARYTALMVQRTHQSSFDAGH